MTTNTARLSTLRNTRINKTRRLLVSVAVLGPLLIGVAASAQATVPADDMAHAQPGVTAHDKAKAATQYVRIEQVVTAGR